MEELKSETVNACWKNSGSEIMNDFKGFLGINEEIRKIIHTARQVGGEVFADMHEEEKGKHI